VKTIPAWRRRLAPAAAALGFAAAALLAAAAFAPGRFGADVGAAVDLPVGAAVAAATCLGVTRRWRAAAIVVAAPLAALALLAAIDLATGGDSHLTRSVLDAGGLRDVGQVAERRLRLSAHNFARYATSPVLWIAVACIAAGLIRWPTVREWFAGRPYARAGWLGAVAAAVAAILVNDSGGLLLMIGAGLVALVAGVAWATRLTGSAHAR
jgi:hypothetical protein